MNMKTFAQSLLFLLLGCTSPLLPAQVPGGQILTVQAVQAGQSFTILSASEATTGATYRWICNGELLSGATSTSYTGSRTTAGTYMFIRQAMQASLCHEWMTSNPYIVVVSCGATLLSGSHSQTVCEGRGITPTQYVTTGVTNAAQVSVSGLPPGVHSSWSANTLTLSGTPLTSGRYVYTLTTCGADKATGTLTVTPAPVLTLVSGHSAGTPAPLATAIKPILYTTSHASGAALTAGTLPKGTTGAWRHNVYTISGTPTETGTFNYTLTTTNTKGCRNDTISGTLAVSQAVTYTNCQAASFNIGAAKASFASPATYNINGLIVSAPVLVDSCRKGNYKGGANQYHDYGADCRSNIKAEYGDLFSWCMVARYADILCPSPWRVPTREDFCTMSKLSPVQCASYVESPSPKLDENGWLAGGYCNADGGLGGQNGEGYYWSSSQRSPTEGWEAEVLGNGFRPQGNGIDKKYYGQSVRCVRNKP
jgi:uncharacterized protein (TIGR02145 family)